MAANPQNAHDDDDIEIIDENPGFGAGGKNLQPPAGGALGNEVNVGQTPGVRGAAKPQEFGATI